MKRGQKIVCKLVEACNNVSRFGLAVRRQAGKQGDLGSNPLRLSTVSLQKLWSVDTVL